MSRYLASLSEQACWSLLNLGLNLALIRFLVPEAYGAFVFWSTSGFVLSSLLNAVSLTHLHVLGPGDGAAAHRLATERLMHAVTLLFLLLVGAAALGFVLLARGSVLAMPAAALFLPAFLLQQYARGLAFSRGRADTALLQTVGVLALSAGAVLAALLVQRPASANAVLAGLALAYGGVGAVGLLAAARSQLRAGPAPKLAGYAAYAGRSGWIFLGVTATELLARLYVFLVSALHGPAAVAVLSATQLLLRPVPLLAVSWSMVGRVDLARLRDRADWGRFSRLVALALCGGTAAGALATWTLFAGWELVCRHLFGGKYVEHRALVLAWGLSATLAFLQAVLGAALQVLQAFKAISLATTAAAVLAAGAMLLGMQALGFGGAVLGVVAGQTAELALLALILGRELRRRQAPAGPLAAS